MPGSRDMDNYMDDYMRKQIMERLGTRQEWIQEPESITATAMKETEKLRQFEDFIKMREIREQMVKDRTEKSKTDELTSLAELMSLCLELIKEYDEVGEIATMDDGEDHEMITEIRRFIDDRKTILR